MATSKEHLRALEDTLAMFDNSSFAELEEWAARKEAARLKAMADESADQGRFIRALFTNREMDDSSFDEMVDCFLEAAQLYDRAGCIHERDTMYGLAGVEYVKELNAKGE